MRANQLCSSMASGSLSRAQHRQSGRPRCVATQRTTERRRQPARIRARIREGRVCGTIQCGVGVLGRVPTQSILICMFLRPTIGNLAIQTGNLTFGCFCGFCRVEWFLPSDYSGERILLFLSAWLAERPTGSISAFEFTRQDQ